MNPTSVALINPYYRSSSNPLVPSPATIERLLAHCHRRRYPTRTDVFRPGDPAGTLYYVISGSVSIITEEDDGRELVLGYFGPGEFVGEMRSEEHTSELKSLMRISYAVFGSKKKKPLKD